MVRSVLEVFPQERAAWAVLRPQQHGNSDVSQHDTVAHRTTRFVGFADTELNTPHSTFRPMAKGRFFVVGAGVPSRLGAD
jgi:hypothetical protein